MPMDEFNVEVEITAELAPEQAVTLVEVLTDLGALGAVVSGTDDTISMRFDVIADDHAEAIVTGMNLANAAVDKLGVDALLQRVQLQTAASLERELMRAPDELVGVTEIAQLLGVSKQRVSELRGRPDFPEPIAELAAGPVWSERLLTRFVQGWTRKPGRPRKVPA